MAFPLVVGKGEHGFDTGVIAKWFCIRWVTAEFLMLLCPTPINETGNTDGCVRGPDPVHRLRGPLIQSKQRSIPRRLRRGRRAPQALTSPGLELRNSLVQMREEEREEPL